jgi:hypothetical protein
VDGGDAAAFDEHAARFDPVELFRRNNVDVGDPDGVGAKC